MGNTYSAFILNKISSSMFLKLYTLSYMIKIDDAVYGKEVLDYIRQFDMGWSPSHGTMYPVISSMISDKLIELTYECEGRKYYSITDWGKIYYFDRSKDFKKMLLSSAKFYKTIASDLQL